jgi:hypothetical protein
MREGTFLLQMGKKCVRKLYSEYFNGILKREGGKQRERERKTN